MTQQIPEQLFFEGTYRRIASQPPIFEHPGIIRQFNPPPGEDLRECSGCWRQYLGTWEIREGKLYLIHVRGKYRLARWNRPVWAEWFTGVLRIHGPRGGLFFTIEQGLVVKQEEDPDRDPEREEAAAYVAWLRGEHLGLDEEAQERRVRSLLLSKALK